MKYYLGIDNCGVAFAKGERLERARGIIAAVSALKDKQITIPTKELEQFATILASTVHHAAHTYSKLQRAEREEIITKIYRDAFVRVLRKPDLLDSEVRSLLSKK